MKKIIILILFALGMIPAYSQYCTSIADSSFTHEINQVKILDGSSVLLENNTACFNLAGSYGTGSGNIDKYSDFTVVNSIPRPNLKRGEYYSLIVKSSPCQSSTGGIKVAYIDLNHDFDFLDSNETFIINSSYSTDTLSWLDFMVPQGSYTGYTRMRIVYRMLTSVGMMNSCGLNTFAGETEDYDVYISSCSGFQATATATTTSGVHVLTGGLTPNDSTATTWLWTKNGTPVGTSKIHTTTDSGNFCVKVMKANGCMYEACVSVGKPTSGPNAPNCALYKQIKFTKTGSVFIFSPNANVPSPYTATYFWQFSNGMTSSSQNPTVTFTSFNNWAKLKICIKDSANNIVCCDSSYRDSIIGCMMYCYITKAGDSLYVTTSGGQGGKTYYWSPPGGIFDSKIKAINPGIYQVYVADSFGCYTTCSYTVYPPCNLKAKFIKSNGSNGNVSFMDSTTPMPGSYTYFWDFGDNSNSSAKNPTHEFKANGTYLVKLKVCKYLNSNNQVCCDTTSKLVTITNANPCNRFVPNFNWTISGATYNFTNSSNMTNFNFVSVVWNISNGSTSVSTSPNHTFIKNGTYSVTMTMTVFDVLTGLNCTKSITKTVAVNTGVCGCLKANNTFTKIGFSMIYNNTSSCTDTSSTFRYNHGNGAFDTIPNPTYTYSLPGLYRTVMYVTRKFGTFTCTDSLVRIIQITSTNPCKDSGYTSYYNYPCGSYISPICGCDTVTYPNYCYAMKAGVKQYSLGPCPNDTNYVKICGYVYRDNNKNCAYDTTDQPLVQIPIKFNTTPPTYAYSNTAGYYTIYLPKGTYTLTQILTNQSFQTNQLCPAGNASLTVSASTGGATYCNNNFYDTTNTCQDLATSLKRVANITPGFTSMKSIKYENRGATPVSGVVLKYRFMPGLTVKTSTSATYSVSGNVITWNLGTLAPYTVGYKSANFSVPFTGISLGTIHLDSVWIEPISGDCSSSNNHAYLSDTCVGSWDPNDKAASPAGMTDTSVKTIEYLVRFQNTGNAPAHNVMIEDPIDDNFVKESLKVNGSSHTMNHFYQDNGKVYFEFPNIMLPDSGTDYEASQGFVSYSIDLKPGLAVGTDLKNTAHIFFDFNEAVVTNTTVNTIYLKSTSAITNQGKDMNISIFPNPTQERATIKVQLEKSSTIEYSIYDFQGKLIAAKANAKPLIGDYSETINLESMTKGIYILQIKINGEASSFKLVKE